MLEQLRKSGASIFIYLIFGLLIIIFVINFAPNAGQGKGGGGCLGMTNGVLTVGKSSVNQTGYHIAYQANKYAGRNKVYAAFEMLIRRELLAQAASDRGIRVTKDAVEAEIKKGYFFFAGVRVPDYQVDPLRAAGPGFISEHSFFDDVDGEKFFNFGKFKNWVNTLNVSIGSYYDEQERSMQAALMAELIEDSVRVSRDEVLADYLFEHNTVTYNTVTFSPDDYAKAMRLTDADVARFITEHEADVKAKYAAEERTYKATKPAYNLRVIRIDTEAPTKDATTPEAPAPGAGSGAGSGVGSGASAGSGAGSASATPTPPKAADKKDEKKDEKKSGKPTPDEAKAKLEAARAQIAAGKLKFEDAAKTLSTDETSNYKGGAVGWKPVDNAGIGDKAINDAVKAIKVGEMTPVVVGENAVYLVIAEDKREGDLSYDQVKGQIAAELAVKMWSDEAAKRAALAAFAEASSGKKQLTDMFEKGVNEEAEQRRMEEMIQQMQMQGGPHGALEVPRSAQKDQLAAWRADDAQTDDKGAGGSAAPAAGSAAPAAGSAAPAAGAGSGSGSAAPTTPAPAPMPTTKPLEPSKDTLPQFGDVKKPKAIPQGPVAKIKDMPGLDGVANASTMLFDELTPTQLAKQVYVTKEGEYVLFQLVDKQDPKVADFDKVADQEIDRLRELRGHLAVEAWLKDRCEALAKDGKIKPDPDFVRESDDTGKPLPQVYRPCMSFR